MDPPCSIDIELSIPTISLLVIILLVLTILHIIFSIYSYFYLRNKQFTPCSKGEYRNKQH